MKHLGTKKLETSRLILRPFTLEDAPAMYRNWASDPEVTRYLTWPAHGSVDISRMILQDWISHYEEDTFYQWAIVPKETGEPVGSVSVVSHNDAAQLVQIGYCIGTRWWHQGITSEALQAVIGFFFRDVGMNRIEARHDANNPHSGGVMRKCGMIYEGTHRSSDVNNQGICDACWYSILASEWRGHDQ